MDIRLSVTREHLWVIHCPCNSHAGGKGVDELMKRMKEVKNNSDQLNNFQSFAEDSEGQALNDAKVRDFLGSTQGAFRVLAAYIEASKSNLRFTGK